MIKFLTTIDAKIMNAVQDGYLWIYDRTGVFLATLTFAAIAADVFLNSLSTGVRIFNVFFLGYVGLQCAARYWLQGNGQIKTINEAQLVVRNSRIIRPIFIVFMLWIIITGSMKSQPWHVASAIMSLLWQYMFCILIRDREPKDFFEQRKLAGSEA